MTAVPQPPAEQRGDVAATDRCVTCNGRVWVTLRGEWVAVRETVGMVCQTCGKDYAAALTDGTPR